MQRPLVLVAAWIVAAAVAVGVGFLAVSLVDASASPATAPGPVTGSPEAATGPAAAPSGERATAGGTAYASCVDGTARLAGAPAPGWTVESAPGQVEFRDGTQRIEVRADCSTGSPQFAVEGPRADGGSGGTPAPTTATTVATTAPSSGGHGSDDPPGDDHGGDRGGNRGGGGHGSDD